jgi:hypothetical protein
LSGVRCALLKPTRSFFLSPGAGTFGPRHSHQKRRSFGRLNRFVQVLGKYGDLSRTKFVYLTVRLDSQAAVQHLQTCATSARLGRHRRIRIQDDQR